MYVLDIDPLPKALDNPNSFTLADIAFDKGVDREAYFVPETLTHLYYTPSYQLLDYEDRLTYNHYCGLALCEQFIFLEEHILAPVMHTILRSQSFKLSRPMRDYLQRFIDEEFKHSEMFWRTLEAAAPSRYERRELTICSPHWVRRKLLGLFAAAPQYFQAWIWMALLFEERTIEISRQYKQDRNVDPLFKRVHFLHMVEEAQHVELDKLFLEHVYKRAPMPIRQLNAHLFRQIMALYAAPKLTPWGAVRAVYEINPEQRSNHKHFARDIAGLKYNQAYQQAYYSRRSFPVTFGYLDQFPEMGFCRMPCQDTFRPKSQQFTLTQLEPVSWLEAAERAQFERQFLQCLSFLGGTPPPFQDDLTQNFWLLGDAAIGASISPAEKTVGFIGWMVTPSRQVDAGRTLLATAEYWLAQQGVRKAYGPINGSIWHTYRVTHIDSAPDVAPFDWEPPFGSVQQRVLEEGGYEVHDTFHSTGFLSRDFSPALRLLKPHFDRAHGGGFRIRSLGESSLELQRDLSAIFQISQRAFCRSDLFHSLTETQFLDLYAGASSLPTGPSSIIEDAAGCPLGFLFAFVERELVVVKSVASLDVAGAKHGMRRWAPANGMLYAALKFGADHGLAGAVSALVRDGATSRFMERYQKWAAAWQRKYSLYAKRLDAATKVGS